MKNFESGGVTLTVFFDIRRQKADSTYPVKYRVTYQRKRAYFSSGIDLTADQWHNIENNGHEELSQKQVTLQAGFDRLKVIIKEMTREDRFSLDDLKIRVSNLGNTSLFSAFESMIIDLEKAGRMATAITYKSALKSIKQFSDHDIEITDINPEWLRKYETCLVNNGRRGNTIRFYISCIRTIFNEVRRDKVIPHWQYPFGKDGFEIKKSLGRKPALSLSQIADVIRFPLNTDTQKRCRDLWLFSYLANGINFSDMLRLKYRDISFGEIHYSKKSVARSEGRDKVISVTLLPELREIIDRWGNPDRNPDNFIFPFIKDDMDQAAQTKVIHSVIRLTNKKMAEISKALNIFPISTCTARHSFASVLKRAGVSIDSISDSLGHSSIRITEDYLETFEQEERAKNALLLARI